MKTTKLAGLLEQKYDTVTGFLRLAEDEEGGPLYPSGFVPKSRGPQEYRDPGILPKVTFPLPQMPDVEAKVRNALDTLWKIPEGKDFGILRACADAGLKLDPADKAKADYSVRQNARKGYWFCRDVMAIIDWLKAERDTATLSEIKEALTDLVNLIKENMGSGGPEAQFMHVSDLIMYLLRRLKSNVKDNDIKFQRNKAKTGLSRVMSVALEIINYMNKLGGGPEVTGRFTPQPAELLNNDRDWFFRHYGDQFGLPNIQTWDVVIQADPSLVPLLSKLIRALKRPWKESALRKAPAIKRAMRAIILRHVEARKTNAPHFEQEATDPMLCEFEESGESPAVLDPQQVKQKVEQRDMEHERRQEEKRQQQIEEDRERHVRSEGSSRLLDKLLKVKL